MEKNKECDCSQCEHWDDCEIGLIMHNPIKMSTNQGIPDQYLLKPFYIKKGQKVCQCVLKEHKSYLMGYESDVIRNGGFGSTDKG